jgi:hypothetical protein
MTSQAVKLFKKSKPRQAEVDFLEKINTVKRK